MAARVGRVIYWAGCGMAAFAVLLAAVVFFSWGMSPLPHAIDWILVYLGVAAASWLFGRDDAVRTRRKGMVPPWRSG